MELLGKVWAWLNGGQGLILVASLLAISEILGTMEFFKKSSVFSYVVDALKWIKGKLSPA